MMRGQFYRACLLSAALLISLGHRLPAQVGSKHQPLRWLAKHLKLLHRKRYSIKSDSHAADFSVSDLDRGQRQAEGRKITPARGDAGASGWQLNPGQQTLLPDHAYAMPPVGQTTQPYQAARPGPAATSATPDRQQAPPPQPAANPDLSGVRPMGNRPGGITTSESVPVVGTWEQQGNYLILNLNGQLVKLVNKSSSGQPAGLPAGSSQPPASGLSQRTPPRRSQAATPGLSQPASFGSGGPVGAAPTALADVLGRSQPQASGDVPVPLTSAQSLRPTGGAGPLSSLWDNPLPQAADTGQRRSARQQNSDQPPEHKPAGAKPPARYGAVYGTLMHAGKPLVDCQVVLVPLVDRGDQDSADHGRKRLWTRTDESGVFWFRNVPPGPYKLYWRPKAQRYWIRRLSMEPDVVVRPGETAEAKSVRNSLRTIN